MMSAMKQGSAVRQAGWLGLVLAVAAAVAFVAITVAARDYPPVARYGGAAWVFLLTWIITMPVLAPRLRRRP